jgi:hypothetical protein
VQPADGLLDAVWAAGVDGNRGMNHGYLYVQPVGCWRAL